MRWPWQKKTVIISEDLQKQLDNFAEGLDQLRNVAGDLRQTNIDMRVQLGEDVIKERVDGPRQEPKRS